MKVIMRSLMVLMMICSWVRAGEPPAVKEKMDDRIPQALAVTFLLDSRQGKIVARSENFIYSENPPVKIPENWATIISAKSIDPNRSGKPKDR